MEEQGLAQQAVGPQQGMEQGNKQQEMQQLVIQVMQLLQQGITPEELLKEGVPQQIIDVAMQLLQQQSGQGMEEPMMEEQHTPTEEQGLAQLSLQ